jgi:hypothetical protein
VQPRYFDIYAKLISFPKNFVKSLKGYESILFNPLSPNELIYKVQSGLGIGMKEEVVPWQRRTNVNSTDCSRVCSVIGAYRLLDVVAMLDGAHPAPSIERCFYQIPSSSFRVSASIHTSSCLKRLQGMDKLENWPKVLDQFRTTLEKSKKTTQFMSNPTQDRCGPLRLLRLIARNNTTKNYTAIEANFLYAAMHIACMNELRFQNELCPDLPDNLDSLLRG